MAFELIEIADSFHVEFFKRGQRHRVLARVGRDRERKTNYFAEISLEPHPTLPILEYRFCLVCVWADTEERYFSGLDIPKTISPEERKKILNVVCSATKALLDHVKPAEVYRITRDRYIGEAGLEKHQIISLVFAKCGYEVTVPDPYRGQRIWVMKRL